MCPGRPRTLQPRHVLRSLRTRHLPQIPEATVSGIVRCLACSSAIHEKEDCPYRDVAREMRAAGIDVTPRQLREIDDKVARQ